MKTLALKNNTLSEYKKVKRSSDRKETALSWLFLSPYALHYVVFSMVPLAMGLSCGNIVLTVAVLSILITAPLGAFCIDLTYRRLLSRAD